MKRSLILLLAIFAPIATYASHTLTPDSILAFFVGSAKKTRDECCENNKVETKVEQQRKVNCFPQPSYKRGKSSIRGSKPLLKEKGILSREKYCVYKIDSIEDGGTLLRLQDGSEWHISLSTSHRALQWAYDEPVVISLSFWPYPCCHPYKYVMTNNKRKESVHALLFSGPAKGDIVTIEYIDHQSNYLCLTDGSRWYLENPCDGDHAYFSEGGRYPHRLYRWQVGHKIIQGRSGAWFGKKHILINVDEKNYLEARALKPKKQGEIG